MQYNAKECRVHVPVTFSLKLIDLFKPETYNYLLGDSILVAPVLSDPSDVSVTFPAGRWVAWWNETLVFKEGDVAKFTALPLEVFPAFIKASTCASETSAACASGALRVECWRYCGGMKLIICSLPQSIGTSYSIHGHRWPFLTVLLLLIPLACVML